MAFGLGVGHGLLCGINGKWNNIQEVHAQADDCHVAALRPVPGP